MNTTESKTSPRPAWAVGSYRVRIFREVDRFGGPQWIAYDRKSVWRCRGAYKSFDDAMGVATWLFHADEVESAEWNGGSVTAWIFTAWEIEAERR